ncbi:MAG: hypothetical protein KC656_33575 [Myxococcales bacterium]|nr:hypothetical protein [Myxococcales bacterium]
MSIRLHLVLVSVLGVVGLLVGFGVGITAFDLLRDSLPAWATEGPVPLLLFGMPAAAVGAFATRRAFTRLVEATCPRCGGAMEHIPSHRQKAVFAGSVTVPITYRCRTCGHVHRTKVSDGPIDHLP